MASSVIWIAAISDSKNASPRGAGGAAAISDSYLGFFLFGFAFLAVISSRVFTGMASIRRATSSSDNGCCSFFANSFMVWRLDRG